MAIGRNEVRITKVYTVEAGEFSAKHDPTPNWRENGPLAHGANTFNLRIEAEAGETIATNPAVTYSVQVQALCLTNPLATMFPPGILIGGIPAVAFPAGGWEYQASEETYTRSWNILFPVFALAPWHLNQVYQFFVTLIDTAAGPKQVACFAASEPFLLV
jgi:hypothetical protein